WFPCVFRFEEVVGVCPSDIANAGSDQVLDHGIAFHLAQVARALVTMPGEKFVASPYLPEDSVLSASCSIEWFRNGDAIKVAAQRLMNRLLGWRQPIGVDDPQAESRRKSRPASVRVLESRWNPFVAGPAI